MIKIKELVLGDGIPKLCVPLIGNSREDILTELEEVKKHSIDMIEWRLDHFSEVHDLEAVLSFAKEIKAHIGSVLFLATFRSAREGGANDQFSDAAYFQLNKALMKDHVLDLIDLELFMDKLRLKELISTAHIYGVHVVMSNHDFRRTPSKDELITRLMAMQRMQADVLKIAVMPQTLQDTLQFMQVGLEMKMKIPHQALVMIAMGEKGILSRYSGEQFGSALTFATLQNQSAPGQLPYDDLHQMLQLIHHNLSNEE